MITEEQKKHMEDLENWITFIESHYQAKLGYIKKKIEELEKILEKIKEELYSI